MSWLSLHVAAITGNSAELQDLLRARVDVNCADEDHQSGWTALIKAAQNARADCARLLLQARADANAAGTDGYTALIFAAREGDEESVRLLLKARADVKAATPSGLTALRLAERRGHHEIVGLLKAAVEATEVAVKVVEPNSGYPVASSKVVSPASGRFITSDDEEVSILPTTKWEEIKPTCGLLEELRTNPHIRSACPEINVIAEDIEQKYEGELANLKSMKDLLQRVGKDGAHAILAYTYDVGEQKGSLYFEMNTSLRRRQNRAEMMKAWGVFVHYALKGMASLEPYQGPVFRGMPNRKYIAEHYEQGRLIEWGAFSSTSTSSQQAIGFMKDTNDGVLLKIKVKSGRVLGRVSFFPSEGEVLLSPKCRFTVISEEPYYNPDLKVYMLDLVETKDVFQS
eukprot:Skav215041  [mRNA]  locus=scaffold2053:7696:8895:+ [translate_table: standard]